MGVTFFPEFTDEGVVVRVHSLPHHHQISARQSEKNNCLSTTTRFPAPRQSFKLFLFKNVDHEKNKQLFCEIKKNCFLINCVLNSHHHEILGFRQWCYSKLISHAAPTRPPATTANPKAGQCVVFFDTHRTRFFWEHECDIFWRRKIFFLGKRIHECDIVCDE